MDLVHSMSIDAYACHEHVYQEMVAIAPMVLLKIAFQFLSKK